MKNIKLWIVMIIFIIVILIISILTLMKNFYGKTKIEINIIGEAEESIDIEKEIVQVKDHNTFYSIEKNLQRYCLYAKVKNIQAVYEILSEKYKTKNSITQENVLDNFTKINDKDAEFLLRELYLSDSFVNPIYYAYGELLQNGVKEGIYFIIYVDQANLTWAVEPIEKEKYAEYIKQKSINEEFEILLSKYNKFSLTSVDDEQIVKKYFKDYIYNSLHDIQRAYNLLDKEYRTNKFGNIENYKVYINNKKNQLISMDIYSIKGLEDFKNEDEYNKYIANLNQKDLKQYAITNKEEYKQYVCIDEYDNYYIFNETAPMQYTVILDTYTIDLPEFIEKYDRVNEEEKVLLNIQKCFEALNDKDYAYVYNKLDKTFKDNNFKTLTDFEAYIKKNFFEINELSATNPQKQGDIYLYDIIINDGTEKDSNSIKKTFVMLLKENRDFVMSFGV